jgi:hypothetical protein
MVLKVLVNLFLLVSDPLPASHVPAADILVDQRNDFQGFNRNLREFASRYLGSGNRALEGRVTTLLETIESLRLSLSPGHDNATGITQTGALTSAPQRELDDNELLTAAINAADSGDRSTARRICNHLLGSLGCNLFAQSCCRIIMAGDDEVPAGERLKGVHRALATLLAIKPPPGQWTNDFQSAIDTAKEMIESLFAITLDDISNLSMCRC